MSKIIILSVISLLFFSCENSEKNDVLQIITTTSFVDNTIHRIAGDKLEITNLIAYGQDPHSYEPAPRDIAKVEKADLVFVNGFDLEEGLLKILKNASSNNIIELSKNIETLESSNHDHEGPDPHTWMSPLNVIQWVKTATDALIKLNPENKDYFLANKNSYTNELLDLHNQIEKSLSVIDYDKRIMVTDHNSFAYFAREYNFTVAGTIIPSVSSNNDTSARSIVELIKIIKQNEVKAIFIGNSSGNDMTRLAESIEHELGHPIKIITLLTGSLDNKNSSVDSYIAYMRFNVDRIILGLSE